MIFINVFCGRSQACGILKLSGVGTVREDVVILLATSEMAKVLRPPDRWLIIIDEPVGSHL